MDNQNRSYYKRLFITLGVIGAIVLIIFLITLPKDTGTDRIMPVADVIIKAEEANIKYVRSILDVYYLSNYDSYPLNAEDVLESEEISDEDKSLYKNAIEKGLLEFDYKVKGNKSGYKITYKSATNEIITVTGDFENDYQ